MAFSSFNAFSFCEHGGKMLCFLVWKSKRVWNKSHTLNMYSLMVFFNINHETRVGYYETRYVFCVNMSQYLVTLVSQSFNINRFFFCFVEYTSTFNTFTPWIIHKICELCIHNRKINEKNNKKTLYIRIPSHICWTEQKTFFFFCQCVLCKF